jgi:ATPase subunit of ABC transporter with duplicated ATPase domains
MADPGSRGPRWRRFLDRFGAVQEEYEHLGGYALEAQAREVLHGLGFEDDRDRRRRRQPLGRMEDARRDGARAARPARHPADGRADQPSRHRVDHLARDFLKSLPGSLLMTSHDREFMNRIVSKIAEIDSGEITAYSGNYDFYERERAIREANREAAYARQQAMLAKEQRFIERFAGARRRRRRRCRAASRRSRRSRRSSCPKKRRVVKFEFRTPPRSGDQVATLERVSKRYGKRVVHDGVNLNIRRGERWCVMGKNGAGKSTLLKMIAGATDADEGEVKLGASLSMGYFAQQSLDLLDPS